MKLNVPRVPRLPSLSKTPHAEPAKASGLMRRSRYLSTFKKHSRGSRYVVIFHASSIKLFTTEINGAEFKLTAVKRAGVCELTKTILMAIGYSRICYRILSVYGVLYLKKYGTRNLE